MSIMIGCSIQKGEVPVVRICFSMVSDCRYRANTVWDTDKHGDTPIMSYEHASDTEIDSYIDDVILQLNKVRKNSKRALRKAKQEIRERIAHETHSQ